MAVHARVMTVVLNYRHVDDTVRCVRSLLSGDFPSQRIVVVDNAEDGPTTQTLRDQLGADAEIIASGDNLGYAGGNNIGIDRALRHGAEFVWLVNPDVVVDPGTLSELVRTADAHPDAGVVGCRILRGTPGPRRIESDGGSVDASRYGRTPLRHSGRFVDEISEHGVRDVGFVSGACLLLRTDLVRDIGMLPEEYFLYFEETDYCLRVQQAGRRTVITARTAVTHLKRSAGPLPTPSYLYYMCRNRIHFGTRHFGATAEEVTADLEPFVAKARGRVRRHAPHLLDTFDGLVSQAFEDGRRGRFGRAEEIEAVAFDTDLSDPVPADDQERDGRDIRRLLRRIQRDAAERRALSSRLDKARTEAKRAEQRVRAAERRASDAEHRLAQVRASRTWRAGRIALGPMRAARRILRRR